MNRFSSKKGTLWRQVVVVLGLAIPSASRTYAQQPPPIPAPAVPPPAAPGTGPSGTREAQLEDRIRQLEAMVNKMSDRMEELNRPPLPGTDTPASAGAIGTVDADGDGVADGVPDDTNKVQGTGDADNVGSVVGGAGSLSPTAPTPSARFNMPAPNQSIPLKARFGPGFELMTEDEEYQFQFHDLTQVEYKGYLQGNQNPVVDSFDIPRQWWIFSGRLTKPIEYFAVPAFGFNNVNLLDAFINIHYDDRIQFKVGRFKTPFTYEFYSLPINGLISPERSLFFNNFGLNRDIGGQVWGQFFEKRLDYAVGIFNGNPNSYLDTNDSKDVAAFLNFRPFGNQKGSLLENFNFGGSTNFGNRNGSPIPNVLRTTAGNATSGESFLAYNQDVRESGDRAMWDLHAALYYKHLSLLSEWGSGFQNLAHLANLGNHSRVPVDSFYVQGGYFITGETVSARGALKPLRPFDLRKGKRGPGAIELTSRYDLLQIGQQVFDRGFADPNLWSNRVYTINAGINWYPTQYTKVYLGWEHTEYGDPVQYRPGALQLTNNLFWLRFQVYF